MSIVRVQERYQHLIFVASTLDQVWMLVWIEEVFICVGELILLTLSNFICFVVEM